MSISYQIFMYVSFLSVSMEAKVTITIGEGITCNRTATVMCTITPYKHTMAWEIDGNIVAGCEFTRCKPYNTSSFAFDFNTNRGIFAITIDPVKYSYNGKKFKCDDGFTAANTTLYVKEVCEFPARSGMKVPSASQIVFIIIAGLILKNQLFTWVIRANRQGM